MTVPLYHLFHAKAQRKTQRRKKDFVPFASSCASLREMSSANTVGAVFPDEEDLAFQLLGNLFDLRLVGDEGAV